MTLDVETQPDVLSATSFTFVVPQGRIWSLRSVFAECVRGVGGVPNRAYTLTITDGTSVVSAFAAADAGTEPGTCEITWCGAPAGSGATGGDGIVSAPMRVDKCPTGYTITGEIVGAVAGDQWVSATVWLDYVAS